MTVFKSVACLTLVALAAVIITAQSAEETMHEVGLAIAGSAYLLPFYFGVTKVLIEEGLVDPATTPMGGLSGGAITAMSLCAGQTSEELYTEYSTLLNTCKANWNTTIQDFPCAGQDQLSKDAFEKQFPAEGNGSDIYERCRNVQIAYSAVNKTSNAFDDFTATVINDYKNNEELVDLLTTTSYLSCFSACQPYKNFRGEPSMDGGYSATLNDLCPPNVKRCIRTQVYYPNTTESGPYCDIQNTTNGAGLVEACAAEMGSKGVGCTIPPPPDFPFSPQGNLPTNCSASPTAYAFPGEADIYPGRFIPITNFTCFQFQCMSYVPGTPEDIEYLYTLGEQETRAWIAYEKAQGTLPDPNGGGNGTSSAWAPMVGGHGVGMSIVATTVAGFVLMMLLM